MDIEKYIKAHMYGTPSVNPDDKREFMGNFRENVALALTVGQVVGAVPVALVQRTMAAYPTGRIYINGRLGSTVQHQLLHLALAADYPFTLITQAGVRVHQTALQDGDMAVVIADPREPIKRWLVI